MPIEFPPVVELSIKPAHLAKKLTLHERMLHILIDNIPWQDFSVAVSKKHENPPYCALAKQGVSRMYRIPDVLQHPNGLQKLNELPDRKRKVYLVTDPHFVSSELLLPGYEDKEIR